MEFKALLSGAYVFGAWLRSCFDSAIGAGLRCWLAIGFTLSLRNSSFGWNSPLDPRLEAHVNRLVDGLHHHLRFREGVKVIRKPESSLAAAEGNGKRRVGRQSEEAVPRAI